MLHNLEACPKIYLRISFIIEHHKQVIDSYCLRKVAVIKYDRQIVLVLATCANKECHKTNKNYHRVLNV